jgi:hypothetical protein
MMRAVTAEPRELKLDRGGLRARYGVRITATWTGKEFRVCAFGVPLLRIMYDLARGLDL